MLATYESKPGVEYTERDDLGTPVSGHGLLLPQDQPRSFMQRKLVRGVVGLSCIVVCGVVVGVAAPEHSKDPKPWNTISAIIGWTYFFAWSVSFYPQVYLNWKRKSVVGLSFDFEAYNIIGFVCYSVFNCAFFWSDSIQDAYKADHDGHVNLVKINDVVFALHAVLLTVITIAQIFIYDRGSQRVSTLAKFLCAVMVVSALVYLAVVLEHVHGHLWTWLSFLYYLSYIKLFVTVIKYIPQVVLNFRRKSTIGWNVYNVILDFMGGFLSVMQLMIDSSTTHDWSGITGDPAKFCLGFASMVFDVIFMVQHYCLYSDSNDEDQEEDLERRQANFINGQPSHPPHAAVVSTTTANSSASSKYRRLSTG